MTSRYATAEGQNDFNAASLASEACISVVWFYSMVGKEFRKLRRNLPGGRGSSETFISKLRKEISELQAQVRELREKYEASIKGKVSEAVRMIELLDKENRVLRERVADLEKRLNDEKLIVSIGDEDLIDSQQTGLNVYGSGPA
jgi:chromosome segregation ATPase